MANADSVVYCMNPDVVLVDFSGTSVREAVDAYALATGFVGYYYWLSPYTKDWRVIDGADPRAWTTKVFDVPNEIVLMAMLRE